MCLVSRQTPVSACTHVAWAIMLDELSVPIHTMCMLHVTEWTCTYANFQSIGRSGSEGLQCFLLTSTHV